MTVRFLTSWNGYSAGDRATLTNEAALISAGIARNDYVQDGVSPLYPPNRDYAAAVVAAATPTGAVAKLRRGRALSSSALQSTVISLAQAWVLPANIKGFRIGFEQVEGVTTNVSLARYAIVGSAGNTPTQAIDAVANYPSSSPAAITFGGAASLALPAAISATRPTNIQWSDWTWVNAEKGQTLATRILFPTGASWKYSYAGLAFSPFSGVLAATNYPSAGWVDTTDRVTANSAWAINSSNANGNLGIPFIEFMTDMSVVNICEVGDSTSLGTVDSGTQAWPTISAACESLSTSVVLLSSIVRGWGGVDEKSYYNLMMNIINDQRPDILIWQAWSQNNAATDVSMQLAMVYDVIKRCRSAGIVPVISTGIPSNTSGSTLDSARKALNAAIRQIPGIDIIDRDAVLTDGATPARYLAAYGAGTHPNLTGYADMLSRVYIPAIRSAVSRMGVTV